jgi:hypothetical protein
MRARAAASVLQDALRRDHADAAARQALETSHFLRFTACLRGRPSAVPKA